jgi:hypothetical protein
MCTKPARVKTTVPSQFLLQWTQGKIATPITAPIAHTLNE